MRCEMNVRFTADAAHPYSLKQFNGLSIRLPADRRYYPDPANLEWHEGNVFKGN